MSDDKVDEAILKLKAGVSEAEFEGLMQQNKIKIREKLQEGLYLIEIPGDRGFQEIKDIMNKSGLVENIEPELKVKDE